MNILFSIDRKSIPYLFTCISSILKNGGYDFYTIYILHSDLTLEDQIFIKDFFNTLDWKFIEVPSDMFDGFPVVKRYPKQIYYRLAAYLLLPNIDKILYLDVDTIVINSLKDLYEQDFENNWFIACTHTSFLLTKLNQFRLGIPLKENIPYVNTGVMMMNLCSLRKFVKFEEIRSFMDSKRSFLWLPDQDILTSLYGNKVKIVNSLVYNISDRTIIFNNINFSKSKIDIDWVKNNTVVIHYFGKNKPWNENYSGQLGMFYYEIVEELKKYLDEYKLNHK